MLKWLTSNRRSIGISTLTESVIDRQEVVNLNHSTSFLHFDWEKGKLANLLDFQFEVFPDYQDQNVPLFTNHQANSYYVEGNPGTYINLELSFLNKKHFKIILHLDINEQQGITEPGTAHEYFVIKERTTTQISTIATKYQNSSTEISRFKREVNTINYHINNKPLDIYLTEQLAITNNENIRLFLNILNITKSLSPTSRDFEHTEINESTHRCNAPR